MNARLTTPATFDHAGWNAVLGDKEFLKIGNNTYLVRETQGAVAIQLHNTHIVTFHADGRIVLNSGGYRSVTTRQRMNAVTEQSIYVAQRRFEWFIEMPGAHGGNLVVPFEDGAVIDTVRSEVTV